MRATSYPMSRKYSAMVIPVYTDASRAATGMFDVLAIMTVRFISGFPVLGSIRWGNSSNTSVISLPRSPHPMYTTSWASEYFARDC